MDNITYLALPVKTWVIVGGAFVISSILPFLVGLILKKKKGLN